MKISKQRILEIIKEEIDNIEGEKKQKAFGTVRKTAQDAKKDFKKRGDSAIDQADEYTNTERGIVQQINDLLEELALESDIDQGEIRMVLMSIFKRLQKVLKQVKKKKGGKSK